jgi:hypothetical protein
MDRASLFVAVGIALWVLQPPAEAHHSFGAEFDAGKPVSLTGTVTRLEWTNPHAHVHVDVTEPTGARTSWNFELGTPNDLMRGGWAKDSVKLGNAITVNGYAARDGSHLAYARSVILGDGRTVFVRSTALTK